MQFCMNEVLNICQTIGRDLLARSLGVGRQAVSNAVADEMFPASWYAVIKHECDQRGLECPISLFRFKGDQPTHKNGEKTGVAGTEQAEDAA